jgi:uncharacterized protein (DUF934 family)
MSVIVTDNGFAQDDWTQGFATSDVANGPSNAVHLTPDTDPDTLAEHLDGVEMIRVAFPSFSDGRGFTLAQRLRGMGFEGRLRAEGHVLADQYAMARRSGFDEVEISDALAERQPEPQWQARANWQAYDYQSRLRG